MTLHRYMISLLMLIFLAGCEGNNASPPEKRVKGKSSHENQKVDIGTISGNIIIGKSMGLSENVDLTVTMSDNSFVELPALILSQKHYTSLDNQVTIPYELTYHKDEIRSQAKITVSATLYVDGKLIYITDSPTEVINNGIYKNIDLLLVPTN